ncbi:YceI family protein [Psychrobacter sp. M13]|uniref:YceI family protein n=1 Tax=Psychrobacter sp. M13 TaxID=3067275 RepID=UPI00273B1E6B|nr:YceI family protein [Psychrobacter sp. M13]WLP94249.1 YceI family protein [Psychrobacter sp. M13]
MTTLSLNYSAKILAKTLVISSTLAITTLASAAMPTQWELDNSHTRVGFEVEHLGFSTTMGRFDKVDGTLNYNMKTPDATQMSFVIDTNSINTAWEARDEHLRSDDFFDVATYPTMTFKSTQVSFSNPIQAKVTGDFTLLGKTMPLTLDVTLKKLADSPMTKEPVIGFRATGNIDRAAYGMTMFAGGITTNVPIQIDGELIKKN